MSSGIPRAFVRAAGVAEVPPGSMIQVELGNTSVLLVHADRVYAVNAICSHALGYLVDGELDGFEVFCPLHLASFDVRTGEVLRPPATEPISCYAVRIEGADILVEVPTVGANSPSALQPR